MKIVRPSNSLKGKMIRAFILTSVFPLFIMMIFSYINTTQIVKENTDNLNHINLEQTKSSLDVWIDSYEDILFQVYMNDDVVDMVDKINENKDTVLNSGQLRRTLRGMFYTKEYIKSITIITESDDMIFYDLLTGSTTKNSWFDSYGTDKERLYDMVSADNKTHFIATKKAGEYATETYYLFHIAHRIIDYKNVNKNLGIVIVSIDEKMLEDICNGDDNKDNFNFIADQSGILVSSKGTDFLGEKVINWSENVEERKEQYKKFATEKLKVSQDYTTVDVVYDKNLECDIVNISNRNIYMSKLQVQRKIILTVMLISLLILLTLIAGLTRAMMKSIRNLTSTMNKVGNGDLNQRAEEGEKVPAELNLIAVQFNSMLNKLKQSIAKEKEAIDRKKDAEIMALEAQINPHFLYNTLDTINWMAIDKDEFEISNSITCLARILRYGIDKSNSDVTISKEVEWLKQYLFLQQTRLKNSFEFELYVNPEIEECKIHKLLFQPFVENSIIHGFDSKRGIHKLKVSIDKRDQQIMIDIWDNGKGISKELVEKMNKSVFPKSADRDCIGMENAISRIKMYYGDTASIVVNSQEGEYTRIMIMVPQRGDKDEVCDS